MNLQQFQKAAGLSAGLASRWFSHIDAAMKEFGITPPLDQAMFIAQVGHESGSFSTLVESLNYAAERLVPLFGPGALRSSRLQRWGGPKRRQLTSKLLPI